MNIFTRSLFAQPRQSTPQIANMISCVLLVIAVMLSSGCASNQTQSDSATNAQSQAMEIESSHGSFALAPTVVSYEPESFSDPLESFNRPVFAFNDFVFKNIFIPASHGYQAVVPEPVRGGVSNFFSNLREPLNAINHLLQGKGSESGSSVGRFLINSTVGLLGLFDPADHWFDIKEQKATLNQTLASYDVGYGSFLVLPFLGQTDTRNGFSTLIEGIVHPINTLADSPQTIYLQSYGSFHEFAPQADSYETLEQKSEDPYLFFRNLYLQGVMRDQQFKEGAMPSEAFQLNPYSKGQTSNIEPTATQSQSATSQSGQED
ncbi:MlaA family lipoprotein [Flavobacterium sp. W21_SRS_FM6]|uniref:MlaA family lipoprotein n=1 Tax=Flavobacterium sp. W21_SRS_FM6 TaxID=3240268 RepID=UPI003F8F32BC